MSIGYVPQSDYRPKLILRESGPRSRPQWDVLRNFRNGYRLLSTFRTREQALLEFPDATEYFGSISNDNSADRD